MPPLLCALDHIPEAKTPIHLVIPNVWAKAQTYLRSNDTSKSRFPSGMTTKGRLTFVVVYSLVLPLLSWGMVVPVPRVSRPVFT